MSQMACSNDITLGLRGEGGKEQSYSNILGNTQLTRNWFVQNLQSTTKEVLYWNSGIYSSDQDREETLYHL